MCDVNINLCFLNALQLTAHFSEETDIDIFKKVSIQQLKIKILFGVIFSQD